MKEETLEETPEIFIRTCCEKTRGNVREMFMLKKHFYFQKLYKCPCLLLLEYINNF